MKSLRFAAAVAVFAAFSSVACAAEDQRFSALEGVEAQALSAPEMNGVYGQLTIQEIKNAVIAKVANPKLEAFLLAQIDRLVATYPLQVAKVLALLTLRGL